MTAFQLDPYCSRAEGCLCRTGAELASRADKTERLFWWAAEHLPKDTVRAAHVAARDARAALQDHIDNCEEEE